MRDLFFLVCLTLTAAEPLTREQERGKSIFQACGSCHNVLTDARKAGPSLRTLFGKVRLRNGKRTNEENVTALVMGGFNGMPAYQYMFRPDDWKDLLAYLKTLRARPEFGAPLQPIRGNDKEILATERNYLRKTAASVTTAREAKLQACWRSTLKRNSQTESPSQKP